jgi:sugar O-acyltransferase (sialic acid O-acetyltransferase NeuD family)
LKELYIIGAGGLGKEVKSLIQNINAQIETYLLAGFIDDVVPVGTIIHNLEVKGNIEFLNHIQKEIQVVIAIGDAKTKKQVFSKLNSKFISYPTLIHPSSILQEKECIEIGEGSIISANCVLTTDIKIGKHVLLNLNCTIGHDVQINDFVSLMPAVNISGLVHIQKTTYIGTGAIILNGLEIGENAIIGAGAVVTKNIPKDVIAFGVPAKIT